MGEEAQGCPSVEALQVLLEQSEPGGPSSRMELHLAACEDCRWLVASLLRAGAVTPSRPRAFPRPTRSGSAPSSPAEEEPLVQGSRLGRYEITGVLGSGGMANVYSAEDPQLRRRVAIKLLRFSPVGASGLEVAREAMLREAQALARLSHPAVVAIHDVGLHEGAVFIAMEQLEGMSLARWQRERPRSWRERVRVYALAGEGLAAAHAAGLVHRDFKPDNVIVTPSGRVCVVDFGLAQLGPEPGGALALVGTPAYMAPEQRVGGPVTPAADQYSFCVSLWEALQGQRPQPPRPGRRAGLPAGVARILERGLCEDPSARHPSMEALLKALADAVRRPRRVLALAGAALAFGAAALGATFALRRSPPPCDGAPARVAQVWGPQQKARLRARVVGGAAPLGEQAWRRAERTLDDYFTRWSSSHAEACRATWVRQEQSPLLFDARMGCLSERLDEAGALLSLLERAEAGGLARSLEAVGRLSPLGACAGRELQDRVALAPPEPLRAAVELQRRQLAEVKALADAGRSQAALERAREVVLAARGLGFAPLESAALLREGTLLRDLGQPEPASRTLHAALAAAERGGDASGAARAWVGLADLQVKGLGDVERGLQSFDVARAAIQRAGGSARLLALTCEGRGYALRRRGELAAAEAEYRQALALLDALKEDRSPLDLARTLNNLAGLQMDQEKLEDALGSARRALGLIEGAVGPEHPLAATSLHMVGELQVRLGARREGLSNVERSLQLKEQALGPDHPALLPPLIRLGVAACEELRAAPGLRLLERALALTERVHGSSSVEGVPVLLDSAYCLAAQGQRAQALALERQGLSRAEAGYPAEHPARPSVYDAAGAVLRSLGRPAEALALHRRSLEQVRRQLGAGHPALREPLTGQGLALLELGRASEAVAPLEEALAARPPAPGDALLLAQARWGLAQALAKSGGDRGRARELAAAARAGLAGDPRAVRLLPQLDAWLAVRAR